MSSVYPCFTFLYFISPCNVFKSVNVAMLYNSQTWMNAEQIRPSVTMPATTHSVVTSVPAAMDLSFPKTNILVMVSSYINKLVLRLNTRYQSFPESWSSVSHLPHLPHLYHLYTVSHSPHLLACPRYQYSSNFYL